MILLCFRNLMELLKWLHLRGDYEYVTHFFRSCLL
jgi:hypothetical protein